MKRKIISAVLFATLVCNNTFFTYAEEYRYDENDRLIKVIYDDGSYIEYHYDNTGNIIKEIKGISSNGNNGGSGNNSNSGSNTGGGSSGNSDAGDSNNPVGNNNSGGSIGGNNTQNPGVTPPGINKPSIPKPKIDISSIRKNQKSKINARIESKTDKGINITDITISQNDIQSLIKQKQDLVMEYNGIKIQIKYKQLKRTDKKSDFKLTLKTTSSLAILQQQLGQSKKKMEKVEQEIFVDLNSKKSIDFEIQYKISQKERAKDYRSFEIKGKKVKIKNVKVKNGIVTVKSKSGNQTIGILIMGK